MINDKRKKVVIITSAILALIVIVFTLINVVKAKKVNNLIDLGQKYILEGNYEEAIITFEKAIEIDDKKLTLYLQLGHVYDSKSDYSSLIDLYHNAITDSNLKSYDKEILEDNLNEIINRISIDNIEIKLIKNQPVELPETIEGIIDGVKVNLSVKWDEINIDTSEVGEYELSGVLNTINQNVVAIVKVMSKPGNDINNVATNSQIVYDEDEEKVYYVDPYECIIKKYDLIDDSIEKLNVQKVDDRGTYCFLNLYKDNLYFYNRNNKSFNKYDLETNEVEELFALDVLNMMSVMRVVDNYLYYMLEVETVELPRYTAGSGSNAIEMYTPSDTKYDIHAFDLDKLEDKVVTQVIGYTFYFDNDGSIIGSTNERKIRKYDINNNYELKEVDTEGIPYIRLLSDNYIYFDYYDYSDGVGNSKSYMARVDIDDLGELEVLSKSISGMNNNDFYELDGQLYAHQKVKYTYLLGGSSESINEYLFADGYANNVIMFRDRDTLFPISKIGEKLFYFNEDGEIVIY